MNAAPLPCTAVAFNRPTMRNGKSTENALEVGRLYLSTLLTNGPGYPKIRGTMLLPYTGVNQHSLRFF
jgi:hypothetical protein